MLLKSVLVFEFVFVLLHLANACPQDGDSDCAMNYEKCVDKSEHCALFKNLCENFFFRPCVRRACPRTCKVCGHHHHHSSISADANILTTQSTTTTKSTTKPTTTSLRPSTTTTSETFETTSTSEEPTTTPLVETTSEPITTTEEIETTTLQETTEAILMSEVKTTKCDSKSSPIDVVLILDGSASIGADKFNGDVLDFTKKLAGLLNVSRDGNHMAVVQFASWAILEFPLTKYYNVKQMEQAIDNIKYMDLGTVIGESLKLTRTKAFKEARGGSVPKVAIIMTDGYSFDDSAEQAELLRDDGVKIFAVGVGAFVDNKLLNDITGDSKKVFNVESFEELSNSVAGLLTNYLCDADQKAELKKTVRSKNGSNKTAVENPSQMGKFKIGALPKFDWFQFRKNLRKKLSGQN